MRKLFRIAKTCKGRKVSLSNSSIWNCFEYLFTILSTLSVYFIIAIETYNIHSTPPGERVLCTHYIDRVGPRTNLGDVAKIKALLLPELEI
jgi:hypothetical protein